MKTEQAKKKPVAEVRFGNIAAAIWQNETESGPRYNVTIERTYRDGDDFGKSQSFGPPGWTGPSSAWWSAVSKAPTS